jgi:branched-subunit amino acid aminotransferase/4-amino-4-deoxychorismate lyase
MVDVDMVSETLVPSPEPLSPFGWAFVDGSFPRTDEARVSVHAHVLSYGTGTFEGIRATWNDKAQELYLLEPAAHYERMHRSARALGLTLPDSTEELVATTVELLRRNEARSDVYLRPLLPEHLAGELVAAVAGRRPQTRTSSRDHAPRGRGADRRGARRACRRAQRRSLRAVRLRRGAPLWHRRRNRPPG